MAAIPGSTEGTERKESTRPEDPEPRDSLLCDVDVDNGQNANNEGEEEGNHKAVTLEP